MHSPLEKAFVKVLMRVLERKRSLSPAGAGAAVAVTSSRTEKAKAKAKELESCIAKQVNALKACPYQKTVSAPTRRDAGVRTQQKQNTLRPLEKKMQSSLAMAGSSFCKQLVHKKRWIGCFEWQIDAMGQVARSSNDSCMIVDCDGREGGMHG